MKSPIDFHLLCEKTHGYAVRCHNQSDAELFVEWAKKLFPDMCKLWSAGETNFARHGSETAYTFNEKFRGGWRSTRLMYGAAGVMRELGFTIIDFDEILQEDDLADADSSLDILFG